MFLTVFRRTHAESFSRVQPVEELTLAPPDPEKAGHFGKFDVVVGELVSLAAQEIQQEQAEVERVTLAHAEKHQKGANGWHQRMLAKGKEYWARRATANTTLNQNLELFSLYLDTLMLDQAFIWVSRCSKCVCSLPDHRLVFFRSQSLPCLNGGSHLIVSWYASTQIGATALLCVTLISSPSGPDSDSDGPSEAASPAPFSKEGKPQEGTGGHAHTGFRTELSGSGGR